MPINQNTLMFHVQQVQRSGLQNVVVALCVARIERLRNMQLDPQDVQLFHLDML